MKKIIISLMLLAFATVSFSQQIVQKRSSTQADYLKKSKKQKKAGRILLAGGACLIATSFIIPRGELEYDGICIGGFCSDKYKNDGTKSAFFIAGGISALGSIPLFIISGKNRRKAARVSTSLKMETRPFVRQALLTKLRYPALMVNINL